MANDVIPPEIEAKFPEVVEEWTRIGLSTEPADRARAEAGARRAYEIAGLAPPELYYWCESPLAGVYAAAHAAAAADPADFLARMAKGDKPADAGSWVSRALWGQHDAWLSSYDALRDMCEEVKDLDGLMEVARSSGWWWVFDQVCILTERPNRLLRDTRGRLHCEDGPALTYPDGLSLWVWHGVSVPEKLIAEPVTAEQLLAETNQELRRVILERLGYERLLSESKAVKVSADEYGTLWRIPAVQRGEEDVWVVDVLNSTPEPDGSIKRYVLRVPPNSASPRGAIAWTFNLSEEEYAPDVMS